MRLGLPGLFDDDDGSDRHGYGNDAKRKHETGILHFLCRMFERGQFSDGSKILTVMNYSSNYVDAGVRRAYCGFAKCQLQRPQT
jgi:hypothetical protein